MGGTGRTDRRESEWYFSYPQQVGDPKWDPLHLPVTLEGDPVPPYFDTRLTPQSDPRVSPVETENRGDPVGGLTYTNKGRRGGSDPGCLSPIPGVRPRGVSTVWGLPDAFEPPFSQTFRR